MKDHLKTLIMAQDYAAFSEYFDEGITIKVPGKTLQTGKNNVKTAFQPFFEGEIRACEPYLSYLIVRVCLDEKMYAIKIKTSQTRIQSIYIEPQVSENRYRIDLSYNGTAYEGYQRQPKKKTIQGEIEAVLKHLLQTRVDTFSASRTDRGVHARMQVIHADMNLAISTKKLAALMNQMLPEDIHVQSVIEVPQVFHARYDALEKTYRYYLHHERDPFKSNTSVYHTPFDIDMLDEILRGVIGHHDFSNFCKKTDKDSTKRTILNACAFKEADDTVIEITGKGFLRSMVRMIVGLSLKALKSDQQLVLDALHHPNVTYQKYSAPPQGLVLMQIKYN